jgi:hypothetical protein
MGQLVQFNWLKVCIRSACRSGTLLKDAIPSLPCITKYHTMDYLNVQFKRLM